MLPALAVLAVVLVTVGRSRADRRITAFARADSTGSAPAAARPPLVEDAPRRLGVCVAAAIAFGWAVAGTPGLFAGAAAGVGVSWWLGRLEPPSRARRKDAIARDLPLAADLLAACSEVGLPPDRSLTLVATALPGPLGEMLSQTAARLALGADPSAEWARVAADEALGPLGRTMVRSMRSGAPLTVSLQRLAEDRRRDRRLHAQVRARNVGVQAAGPLGLCFLPSFMVIGVVPTVVGTFSTLVLD